MIWLMAYTVVETTVLFTGSGLAFNLAMDSQNLNGPLIAGCGIAGLVFGILFAWLMRRFFEKAPAMGWVWAYTFLSGWVVGAAFFYLTVADANRPLVLVALACCFGTLPGLAMGWLLARIRPALRLPIPVRPDPALAPVGRATFGPPTLAPAFSFQPGTALLPSPGVSLDALKQRLRAEVIQLEVAHPGGSSEVIELGPDRMAALFTLVNYLGKLKFYIVCGLDYPAEPPEAVFLEFEPADRPDKTPLKVDYQGQALDTWQPGFDLETIVKDAALQVEENMIS